MSSTTARPADTRFARVRSFAVRALRMELRIYSSIGRAIARRPAIAAGASGFRYERPVLMILCVFIGLSAIEIPIIDLIVHRWLPIRIFFLVIGIWGLTWMVGLLCAYLMRPHTVGPEGIVVREGLEVDIPLSWADIASVERRARTDEPKTPRVTEGHDGRILSLRIQDATNIEIALERPTPIHLPGLPPKGGTHSVSTLRLWVDDTDGFVAAVRRHIP
ncbi:hypothetical protein [Microbacterium sp. JZ31]|uniref:hypothetical protein n=1 Tax=Microbacterium sp. JZ31 TaxID=1906274 RepID=UPI00193164B2|nr:hypothetical protein [Microbacterium sp. JZ31]